VAGPQTAGRAELHARLGESRSMGPRRSQPGRMAPGSQGNAAHRGREPRDRKPDHPRRWPPRRGTGRWSPDLSKVAPLFLVEAGGMLRAMSLLPPMLGRQSARIAGTATDIVYEGVSLDSVRNTRPPRRTSFPPPRSTAMSPCGTSRQAGSSSSAAPGSASVAAMTRASRRNAELADGFGPLAGSLRPAGSGVALALDQFAFARRRQEARPRRGQTTVAVCRRNRPLPGDPPGTFAAAQSRFRGRRGVART
jgi:hypothetical protein